MKKIVFDLLNNDGGQEKAIIAAKNFLETNSDYSLILVGDEKKITSLIPVNLHNRITIINSLEIVSKLESPRDALRSDSSMLKAFNALYEQNADGILSSGDSASYIILSSLKVKRINGISRPAFMPILPTTTAKNIVVLDVGANIDVKPEYLVEWANVASEFYKVLFPCVEIPHVGQLNIGTEKYKGSEIAKEANKLLSSPTSKFIFKGFIEPNNVINGDVDIVVTDGYAGNIFLKTMESSFLGFAKLIKGIFLKNVFTKFSALFVKNDFKKLKSRFDYRNIGGAFIVGLDKIVVKAHGGSDEIAFFNALNQIKLGIENNIIEKISAKSLAIEGNKNE